MANDEHVEILLMGVDVWNKWRQDNPGIQPDLREANLRGLELTNIDLHEADMFKADLRWAKLREADLRAAGLYGACLHATLLRWADLSWANLRTANLRRANLHGARLLRTIIEDANLNSCYVYGTSVWDVEGTPKDQSNLIITHPGDPIITVDDLEVAQFIYLLLNHKKLRNVINAMTQRGVLILGRFGGGGLDVLHAIAEKLREEHYLPIIFEFDRPTDRNYTETVKTLAGLSRFVIVDLSGPSVPQELQATVPHFKIPFVPIIERDTRPYSMFTDLLEYPWVLKPIIPFGSTEELVQMIPEKILTPAEEHCKERQEQRAKLFC